MTEQHRPSPEPQHSTPAQESVNGEETSRSQVERAAERPHDLEAIQQRIEEHAKKSAETSLEATEAPTDEAGYITRKHKQDALKRTLRHISRELSPSQRVFSKIIHNRVVDTVSEVGSKTVARPSALLGGGMGAFIGSSVLLFYAKKYGFRYNFTAFLLLFVLGFGIGIAFELLIKLLRKRR
jgi:hypothetical protein